MTKELFMQRLARGLADCAPASRKEIMADFSEHFAIAGSQGKSEAQICRELGDPDQIAASFLAEMAGKPGKTSLNWLALLGALLLNLLLALPVWLSLLALLLSLWLADLAVILAALALLVSSFWQKGVIILLASLYCLACFAFSWLFALGLLYLSRFFFSGLKSYLAWQKKLIISRKKSI